jgi:hypothetical protein
MVTAASSGKVRATAACFASSLLLALPSLLGLQPVAAHAFGRLGWQS